VCVCVYTVSLVRGGHFWTLIWGFVFRLLSLSLYGGLVPSLGFGGRFFFFGHLVLTYTPVEIKTLMRSEGEGGRESERMRRI
jgi:hypothetical protein